MNDEILSNLTTTVAPGVDIPTYWGYIGLAIAVFFFGSNYVPVKKFETGDGLFFQLVLCMAIWTVGFIVHCFRQFPRFYPLPLLGGFFWATGNINTVPIIKCIGIGMGMLLWGTTSLVIGWANARFGWFGIKAEVPSKLALNYVGVCLAASSAIFYLFVKTETAQAQQTDHHENEPLIQTIEPSIQQREQPVDFYDKLNPKAKRMAGTFLAIISGVLYGVTFTPYLYVVDNYSGASQNGLDYVFSLYTGIFLTSIIYFFIYCIIMKNKPFVNPKSILPGLASGWMW